MAEVSHVEATCFLRERVSPTSLPDRDGQPPASTIQLPEKFEGSDLGSDLADPMGHLMASFNYATRKHMPSKSASGASPSRCT